MSSNEEQINMALAITCLAIMAISAFVGLFAICFGIYDKSVSELIVGFIMVGATSVASYGAWQFSSRMDPARVRNQSVEHVLTWRQKRDLRRKRGEVVLEKALIEIEQERQNVVHNMLEAANDPDKPPHETQWSPGGAVWSSEARKRELGR